MKWIFSLLLFLISFSAFAALKPSHCPKAVPDYFANFCPSFKSVATCHCVEGGLPQGMCQDMGALYKRMITMFGSLRGACQYQEDVPVQECIDAWNCYRIGGKDSLGRVCSSTARPCP